MSIISWDNNPALLVVFGLDSLLGEFFHKLGRRHGPIPVAVFASIADHHSPTLDRLAIVHAWAVAKFKHLIADETRIHALLPLAVSSNIIRRFSNYNSFRL